MSVVTRLLISGGAMPARKYNSFDSVSFEATGTCLACSDGLHAGHAYSPAEKHRALPVRLG